MNNLDDLKKDKKFIRKAMYAYIFTCGQGFSMERMMAPGIVNMMIACAKELYPDDIEKQKELVLNHSNFFNTQPQFGSICAGVTLGMEIERAKTGLIPNDMIQSVKTALAGPFAGIGDTIVQSLIIPILLSIAIGMSADGSIMGVLFFLGAYFAINVPILHFMFNSGFKLGLEGADKILNSGNKDKIITCIEVLGIIVIGGVVASTVNVQTAFEFTHNTTVVKVQELLDMIIPGLLTMITALIMYYAMKVKKVDSLKMMLIILGIATIGYLIGFF